MQRRPTSPGQWSGGSRGWACAPSRCRAAPIEVRTVTGDWTSWPRRRPAQHSGTSSDGGIPDSRTMR
eukprot:4684162-Lingulodinium_polyedra.AAC.1